MNVEKPKIVVIDDEAVMRDGCTRILGKEGCDVVTAANGHEGLALIDEDPQGMEVVLLDLKMPGMGGMEVLDGIKRINAELPVIVITGYATVDTAVEAMKKGAYDFVAKPFTPDELWLVVHRALEKRRLEREKARLMEEAARSLRDVATEKGKLTTIVNCMAQGVLVTDHEGRIALVNPAASRLLGLRSDECLGKPLRQALVHEEFLNLVNGVLEPENVEFASFSREMQYGDTLMRAHAGTVRDDRQETLGTVTVLEDMSYLSELERMKGNFVAMVAHELRAPLSTIEQNITLILEGLVGDLSEKQRHLLKRAKERSRGLMELIGDLLQMSTIDAGAVLQRKERLQVRDIVQRAVEPLKAEAEAKRITVEFSAESPVLHVLGDRDNLERVFINLVDNAIKYTPEGGHVRIVVSREGDYVKTMVSDNGIGIPADDVPRIFDRFYRVRSEKTRGIPGTGLGLCIVKATVDAHLGSIHIESEEGKGTDVIVLLPRMTD